MVQALRFVQLAKGVTTAALWLFIFGAFFGGSTAFAQLAPRGGSTFSDTGISGFLAGHNRREVHAETET
jgi:hypothetical protein